MANWKDKLGALYGIKAREDSPPPKKNSPRPKKIFQPTQKNSSTRATAPYNFVALPEEILPAPFELKNFREYVTANGNLSGEILLNITALTPLFIGGNGSKSFAPVNDPIIPGSTLRGMFKNIFKVVTCGAFRGRTTSQEKGEDFNDEHIYFRCLMKNNFAERDGYNWTTDLNELYVKRMVRTERDKDGKSLLVKNARPGFLIRKSNGKYFIAPSIYTSNRKEDYILIRDFQKKFGNVGFKDSRIFWTGAVAYCLTGNQWAKQPQNLLDAAAYDAYKKNLATLHDDWRAGKLTDRQHQQEVRKIDKGKQIIRYTKLEYIDPCRENWFELPDEVQNSYRRDRNRGGVDLFTDKNILQREDLEKRTGQDFPDVDTLIPCHFLTDGDTVTAFGHGQCFRIPYKNRIGAALPKNHQQSEKIVDFADAVFGKEKFWASRVYFEDATPKNFSELPEATTHPLMQPNPTSYQLYLVQNGDPLKNWDEGAKLRGYKFYWHNAKYNWQADENELELDRGKPDDKRSTKEMTPLDEGSTFTAKIRFKNLSAVELGALMMIFDLDDFKDAAYKIGQGKPFGFGSVKIFPTLLVEDETAYTKLFGADGWQSPYREENPAAYLDAFKKYLTACGMNDTWKKVMRELKIILDWSLTLRQDWRNKIESMSGNVSQKDNVDPRFKTRAPLPSIFEVVK